VVGASGHDHKEVTTMSTTTTVLERYQPVLSDVERMTLLGFLAAYRGYTRDAYALDLRQFTAWCWQHHHQLFDVRRVDIECFARDLEDRGKARATVARRLCTIVGFYRYAEEEGGVIEHSPAVHIRRPRIDYESLVAHLDRNELGAILVTAGLSSPRDHALVSVLALNGLRVSEAIGANIEALGQERGHRTLTVLRKGGKVVTMPLAPRVARAIDLAVGERLDGPIFVDPDGLRLDRHAAGRIVRRIARRAGIGKRVGPHTLRHAFITAALDAGVHFATSKKQPATPTRGQRCATTVAASPWTGTPPTSSPHSLRAPPADPDRTSGDRCHQTPNAAPAKSRPRARTSTTRNRRSEPIPRGSPTGPAARRLQSLDPYGPSIDWLAGRPLSIPTNTFRRRVR
jgi:integrase/recombinase XerD